LGIFIFTYHYNNHYSEDGTIRGYDDDKNKKIYIMIALIAGIVAGVVFNNLLATWWSITPQLNTISIPNNISSGEITDIRFITFSNGVAVGNANITIGGIASARGVTDADGMLLLAVNTTSNGSISVIAEKPGYRKGISFIRSTEVLEVSTLPSSIISGVSTFVTFQVTSLGKSVPGVSINVSGAGTNLGGITDENGQIVLQINAPDAGKITATAIKEGYSEGLAMITSASQQTLSVSSGQSTLTVSVPVYVSYTVTAGGLAVQDAVVTLSGAATGTGITNSEGKTVILTTPHDKGTIAVNANKIGFAEGWTTVEAVSTQSLNIVAVPTTITTMFPDYVMFTVKSNNDLISEAMVTLTGPATGTGITNNNGQTIILVNSTNSGTITASASKTGFTTGSTTITASGQQALIVRANPSNITNGVPSYVTFTVTGGDFPVSGVTVTVSGGGISSDGMTNSAGKVTMLLTASGTGAININAWKAGYNEKMITLEH
jgi:hypothetical protein